MFVGKVIGTVWSTVKWPQLEGHKLLVVRPYHLADLADLGGAPLVAPGSAPGPGGADCEAVVCIDLLDAGVGDDVVVAFGHAARVAAQSPAKVSAEGLPSPVVPIDAAVVAIVDSIRVALPST
jgi:ethanolamine utilization protein EutN